MAQGRRAFPIAERRLDLGSKKQRTKPKPRNYLKMHDVKLEERNLRAAIARLKVAFTVFNHGKIIFHLTTPGLRD